MGSIGYGPVSDFAAEEFKKLDKTQHKRKEMNMTKRKLASAICKLEGGKHNTKIEDVMQVLTRFEEIVGEELFLKTMSNSGIGTEDRAQAYREKLEKAFGKSRFEYKDEFLADYRAKQVAKAAPKGGSAHPRYFGKAKGKKR